MIFSTSSLLTEMILGDDPLGDPRNLEAAASPDGPLELEALSRLLSQVSHSLEERRTGCMGNGEAELLPSGKEEKTGRGRQEWPLSLPNMPGMTEVSC